MAARFIGFNPLAGFIVAIVFVLVAVFSTLPVRADFRILSSSGGEVSSYLAVFARVRQSGDRVIIDGPCLSACTLVLSTISKNRVCVTRRAVLGFHAPKYVDPRSGRMSTIRKIASALREGQCSVSMRPNMLTPEAAACLGHRRRRVS